MQFNVQAISRSFHIAGTFSPKFYTIPFFFEDNTTTKVSALMIFLTFGAQKRHKLPWGDETLKISC